MVDNLPPIDQWETTEDPELKRLARMKDAINIIDLEPGVIVRHDADGQRELYEVIGYVNGLVVMRSITSEREDDNLVIGQRWFDERAGKVRTIAPWMPQAS